MAYNADGTLQFHTEDQFHTAYGDETFLAELDKRLLSTGRRRRDKLASFQSPLTPSE